MLQEAIVGRDVELDNGAPAAIAEIVRGGSNDCPSSTFSGIVNVGQSWSETHISGGQVYGVGRYVHSKPINVTNINGTKFWVKRSDGQHREFTIDTQNVNFCDGHEVTVILDGGNGPVGILNHTAQTQVRVRSSFHLSYVRLLVLGSLFASGFGILMMAVGSGSPATYKGPNPMPFSPEHMWLGVALLSGNLVFVPIALAIEKFNKTVDLAFSWVAGSFGRSMG